MLSKIRSLTVLSPFKLAVRFSDGTSGVHDCSQLVQETGSLIEALRDPSFFAQASLQDGIPTWPNGFDMDAEWLRQEMLAANELQPEAAAE
ncbi:DUF2442 domain-containing protein [Pelagibacterium sp. 26DY04]|uniref:DUF2442 domain-containing protein n=1 Tax=Pelagibacterium sp. 26DY04 TaxID=2967130 RepID=UPI002814BF30|nr:DUF2442 domain-containing protein [Pelagibacterium sp. 26DY04]WMT85955.1 DUF2442 domain-containing protein [Pelagibacterium sp. 26DY04]